MIFYDVEGVSDSPGNDPFTEPDINSPIEVSNESILVESEVTRNKKELAL